MRVLKRNPWLFGLGVLLAVLAVYGGQARADVTTDQPGSIVIFPKVIADGTRDTLIQLTNTSNMGATALCFYFDATNNCQPVDFTVDLTPQHPTSWRVSTGRRLLGSCSISGQSCSSDSDCSGGNCLGASRGIFLGSVPPRTGFQGELKCFQVDQSGVPIGGNSLKGEALLETLNRFLEPNGQISEYNGIAIQAMSNPLPVCNGGPSNKNGQPCTGASDCCDSQGQNCGTCDVQVQLDNVTYNACPDALVLNHYSENATDLFSGATVNTELTLVPCSEDIENNRPIIPTDPPEALASFQVITEQEQGGLSATVPFSCWINLSLSDTSLVGTIFDVNTTGSTFLKTRIRPAGSSSPGLLGVAEEFHTLSKFKPKGTAAVNLHMEGSRPGDVIVVPQGTGG